jgi:hypothetical protein
LKEIVVACFKAAFLLSPGGIEENHVIFKEDGRCVG